MRNPYETDSERLDRVAGAVQNADLHAAVANRRAIVLLLAIAQKLGAEPVTIETRGYDPNAKAGEWYKDPHKDVWYLCGTPWRVDRIYPTGLRAFALRNPDYYHYGSPDGSDLISCHDTLEDAQARAR